MAIKINERQNFIPIEIYDFTFRFPLTDQAMSAFYHGLEKVKRIADEIQRALQEQEEQNAVGAVETAFGEAEQMLRECFDLIAGQDAYDKVYPKVESVTIMFNYFMQMAVGLEEELETYHSQRILTKYMKD